jgi:CheY-like chemotaxis protein
LKIELQVAEDGEQALNLLFNGSNSSQPCLPDFILLDLNLPKVDGKPVLSAIKKHPIFAAFP